MPQCPFFLFSGSIPVIWRQSENLRCAVFPLRSKSPKTRKGALSTCPAVLATKTIEGKYFQNPILWTKEATEMRSKPQQYLGPDHLLLLLIYDQCYYSKKW